MGDRKPLGKGLTRRERILEGKVQTPSKASYFRKEKFLQSMGKKRGPGGKKKKSQVEKGEKNARGKFRKRAGAGRCDAEEGRGKRNRRGGSSE